MKTPRETKHWIPRVTTLGCVLLALVSTVAVADLSYPPSLPGGKQIVTVQSPDVLKATTDTLRDGVKIAKEAPVIDVMYLPAQNYPGGPWSDWGDAVYADGCFFCCAGDHLSPRGSPRTTTDEYGYRGDWIFRTDPQSGKTEIVASYLVFGSVKDDTTHSCLILFRSRG